MSERRTPIKMLADALLAHADQAPPGQIISATERAIALLGYLDRQRWQLMPMTEREHVTDGSPCWCNPRIVRGRAKKEGP